MATDPMMTTRMKYPTYTPPENVTGVQTKKKKKVEHLATVYTLFRSS